jgi:sodium transport system permease protein
MRWSIIRIIWLRELKDQLRDRRTLFMVAGLPLLLYPILGVAVLKFAVGFVDRKTVIGVVVEPGQPHDFPPRPVTARPRRAVAAAGWWTLAAPGNVGGGLPLDRVATTLALAETGPGLLPGSPTGLSPLPPLAWLSATPDPASAGVDRLLGAAALAEYNHICRDFPLLARDGKFCPLYLRPVDDQPSLIPGEAKLHIAWLDRDPEAALHDKKVDVLLAAPPDFWTRLEADGRPTLTVQIREDDETSRLAAQRLEYLLARWKKHIKEVRFIRKGLPAAFDDPFTVREPGAERGGAASRSMLDLLVRLFPFMLVMWSLAGALYPAVDLCAGEKERGTMETLLISPASREEIVWGKFLTIWMFSAGTALLNLLSMGLTTWCFGGQLPRVELTVGGLFWSVLLLLPLSAFFSAVCLAIGAYARSSKEGQYYLMPLFLATMPLIFLTLAPGVELNSFYSMVPVTGVALLMQRLLAGPAFDQPWFYFVAVMAPTGLYSWLALRWAIDQFQREEVLFREAERVDLRLWVKRLFREKETRPTMGLALCCFALLLLLSWLSEGLGRDVPLLSRRLIVVAAFLAAPPTFMALFLTTRPRQVLALHWPAWPYLAAAVLLVPLLDYLVSLAHDFPRLFQLLSERRTLVTEAFRQNGDTTSLGWTVYVLALAFLSAIGKEIAFRGFIFSGLLMRMRPWPAILVSSFLFAAFHMNVFLLPILFILGVALGVLALRSGSLLPGILLHGSGYALLLAGPNVLGPWQPDGGSNPLGLAVVIGCTLAAAFLLWWQNRRTGSGLIAALLGVPQPVIPRAPDPDYPKTLTGS